MFMTSRTRRLLLPCAGLIFFAALSSPAFADRDRTHLGNDITVGPDEEVSEATCFGCSIRVRGHVSGDVTAFGGSIVVEDRGRIDGDTTVFGGSIRIDGEAKLARDVTVFGGRIHRDPASSVGGDVTTMGGPGWMFLIFLVPFIFLGLFVALIVWLIRLVLRPRQPATA
jgi:hypothetical protein